MNWYCGPLASVESVHGGRWMKPIENVSELCVFPQISYQLISH